VGACSLDTLVVVVVTGGGKVGRRGVLALWSNLQRRAGLRGVRGAVLLLREREGGKRGTEQEGMSVAQYLLPSDTPISRLSDAVPPYTASTPVEPVAGSSNVKFPRPRLSIATSKTSAPPLGPGTTCELPLLVTNMRGGLLDEGAHKAKDMVS
jgi:hypothetical protein